MREEVELMHRVSKGDSQSVNALLESHYNPIYRLLRHLIRNREDAEDLTQEVFLIAQTKGGSFSGEAALRTWLTTIALNANRKRLRREQLRKLWQPPKRPVSGEADRLVEGEWLMQGIEQLPEDQQMAYILHDVHGFSVAEIAAMVNRPEGTIKARLHYARKKLQHVLACSEDEVNE